MKNLLILKFHYSNLNYNKITKMHNLVCTMMSYMLIFPYFQLFLQSQSLQTLLGHCELIYFKV